MPRPAEATQRYMPGLDGLRALAVLAVIAYHLQLGWADGGLLGVGVFFTLSGYLITDLLLYHHEQFGDLGLRNFWLRRARRLLPALFVMLAVVVIWTALFDRSELSSLRGYVLAATFYVSNWFTIATGASYAAQTGLPSPLDHLWSLAVEEQFYLLWPFLLWLGLRFVRGRYRLVGMTLALAAVSTILMAVLYQPTYPTRVYEGTDTRAAGLLIGAALAMVWPSHHLQANLAISRRRLLDGAGALGLVIIGWLVWQTSLSSSSLYRGEILLLSVATAAVVAAAAHPAGLLGRALGVGPLRWLGVRSYGVYLWHYPIIIFTTASFTKPGLLLGIFQIAATIAVSALSWRFIEDPVRHGALGTFWTTVRARRWQVVPRRSWGALGAAVLVFTVAGCDLSGASSSSGATPTPTTIPSRVASFPLLLPWKGSTGTASIHTSCRSVAYIGDSTSEGMIVTPGNAIYILNPAQRLWPQLHEVGVVHHYFRISGARSIVETLSGQANGYTVAKQLRAGGFHGCWMIALGTNDTANVAKGSPVTRTERIQEMMSVIGKQPVLWVDLKTLRGTTDYSEANMLLWNHTLLQACATYPHMRIFDWASVVQPSWYINDEIHYTSNGYTHRAHATALALARAFPASSKSSHKNCLVR